MILNEIVFHKNGQSLRIVKLSLPDDVDGFDTIIVERDGIKIFEIESHLATLIGDCLRHIGSETDFLGLKSHLD